MNNNKNTYRLVAFLIAFILVVFFIKHNNALPHDKSAWQAVFLTDGEVYFGRLSDFNSKFALLDRVYYLKFAHGLQQGDVNTIPSQQLNLIKLGGEAHGPENQMYIAKAQILFIENLKDDSAVVRAIANSK